VLAVRPRSRLEAEVFELWKELNPAGAYLEGVEECVGRIFEGSTSQIQTLLERIGVLKMRARGRLVKKMLDSFEIALQYEEPMNAPSALLGALFGYLVKEGVKEDHLEPLLESGIRSFANARARMASKSWPLTLRILTTLACRGLVGALEVVKREAKRERLKELCSRVRQEAEEYLRALKAPELKEGTYEEVMGLLAQGDAGMGRAHIYEPWLRKALDYAEDPRRLAEKAKGWIRSELPALRRVMRRLARIYGCEPSLEEVSRAMARADGLRGSALIEKTKELRTLLQPYIDRYVVRVPRSYNAEVMETPPYLASMLPTAAAFGVDSLTQRPRQLYLVTTDERFSPMASLADLINVYVHEEMGHDLHFARSAVGYGRRPRLLERISTTFAGPISEGLSFQREMEFLWALKDTLRKARRSRVEENLLAYLERNGGLRRRLLELEFVTRKWRLIRFLRVVGDANINSDMMTLPEFLEWAERETGIDRKTVYYQLFPAHQLNGPGYATSYAVIGQEIAAIERRLRRSRRKLVRLATYGCSLGYPPRSLYRRRLREFARALLAQESGA